MKKKIELKKHESSFWKILKDVKRYFYSRALIKRIIGELKENGEEFDSVYALHTKAGETFLISALLREILKKNGSEKPVFLGTIPYHENILKMFLPKANFYFIPYYLNDIANLPLKNKENNFYNLLNLQYFKDFETSRKLHFYEAMLNEFGVNPKVLPQPVLDSRSKKYAEKKMSKLNLQRDNFIIVAPEADSTYVKKKIFQKLTNSLHERGYDILNISMGIGNKLENATGEYFTFQEAYHVADYAKAIIGTRSGMMDILAFLNKPMYIIYNKFPKRFDFPELPSKDVERMYSLKKLPNINNLINEYNINNDNYNNIKEDILNNFINKIV